MPTLSFSSLALLLLLAAPAAHAQFAVLPYAGYDVDGETALFGIGGEVALPIAAPVALSLRASGEYALIRDIEEGGRTFQQTISQLNLDVIARFGAPGLQPYAGVGVGRRSLDLDTSDNDEVEGNQDIAESTFGANLVGGVEIGGGLFRPFARGRLTVGDGSAFSLVAGVTLRF